jgi:F-type H+-transporting ATPase subunit a
VTTFLLIALLRTLQAPAAAPSTLVDLPDITEILSGWASGTSWAGVAGFAEAWKGNLYALGTALLLLGLGAAGASRREMVPGRLQNAAELVVEKVHGFLADVLGSHTEEHLPFLGTLFLYILFMNLSGLVPLLKAPTSMLETTASLAIVVFVYVQITGVRGFGLPRYLHHLAGSPRTAVDWMLLPLMLPTHLVSEIARPLSLAVRLFGNVMGEDVMVAVFTGLGVAAVAAWLPVGIPLALPMILLGILLSTVQAVVFTLLSSVYIAQVLPEEHQCRPQAV